MSDLISRQAVLDILQEEKSFRCGYDADIAILSIEKDVKELPTAYDVDAVVEELEKNKTPLKEAVVANSNCISITNEAIKMRNSDIDKYIAIVRKGGVNE